MRPVKQKRTLATVLLLLAAQTPAFAVAPDLGEVFWQPDDAHCAFQRAGKSAPAKDDPSTWRFVFVTELVSDHIASVERGYARLDGLLRELQIVIRAKTDNGEWRVYRTFGNDPITIEIDMLAGESRKSKLGQTVWVNYTGTMSVSRGTARSQIAFEGACGADPQS